MRRREFLKFLGIGLAALTVPKKLVLPVRDVPYFSTVNTRYGQVRCNYAGKEFNANKYFRKVNIKDLG